MDNDKVKNYTLLFASKLPITSITTIKSQLENMSEEEANIKFAMMKDTTAAIIISVLVGYYGIDRMYIGDITLGILKLLTCGGMGIWWIIDLFLIIDATKQKNLKIFLE